MNVDPNVEFESLPEEQKAIVRWWIKFYVPNQHRGDCDGAWCDTSIWERHPRPKLCYRLTP